MSDTSAKIVLAVGITALLTSIMLIGGFLGYLYLRPGPEPKVVVGSPEIREKGTADKPTSRPHGENRVPAEDIAKVTFFTSSNVSRHDNRPTSYFGNINIQNYSFSSRTVSFSADGTAARQTVQENTVNGVKGPTKNERFGGKIDEAAFSELTKVLADNDFANEPDSREITSLPAKAVLTVIYKGGEKIINTSNMGKDTPEVTAMLEAINDLEKRTAWTRIEN